MTATANPVEIAPAPPSSTAENNYTSYDSNHQHYNYHHHQPRDYSNNNILASAVEGAANAGADSDLFDGVLGDYELNEIPSLFNFEQNKQMSDDLEALGFSASGQDDEDDEDEEHMGGAVSYSHSSAQVSLAEDDSSNHKNSSANKRNAGEISEDEESANHSGRSPSMSMSSVASSQASSSKKTRRTTANPVASGSTLLAPKPTMSSSTSAPASPTTVTTTFGSKSTKAVASPAVTTSSDDPEAEMTISSTTTNIDTSTAHIKALTGSKGATMCFEHVAGTPRDQTVAIPNLATADTLSPEEKAKFSRDRNRLHARNTRIRKKAYVDELKRTLEVLVKERDAVVVAQKQKTQIEHEERQVRFSVMEEFLRLRGVNETNPERWCAILEDAVTLSLPNYKDYGNHATKKNSKTAAKAMVGGTAAKMNLSGVRDVMKECNDFCKLVVQQQQQQSSSPKKKGSARKPLQAAGGSVSFSCDRDSLLMEGCNVVLDWTSNFQDPSKNDSPTSMRGTFRAKFNPQSNKILAIDMFFDSGSLFNPK